MRIVSDIVYSRRGVIDSINALRRVNRNMVMQSAVLSLLFLSPASVFLRPMTPPDHRLLSLTIVGSFEAWDLVFPLATLFLWYATWSLKRMTMAHIVMAVAWLALGILWVVGGIQNAPSYLFGTGIFALFISAQHLSLIGVWRAEGVD